MMQTERYRTELVYDPNETYEQLGARRQHALDQGRQAVRERRISGDLYLFYEYLIERVGANKYTWIGEDTLAEVFSVDASTIKRWMAKLVRAGLIRRQRQFGTTSRTYISAYDPGTVLLDSAIAETVELDAADPVIDTVPIDAAPLLTQTDQGTHADTVSFRRNDAPTFGADLRRDPKDSHLRLGGGGVEISRKNQALAPEIRHLLEREGVQGFYLAPQLQQHPIEELRAVSRYLDQQHNVRDRARLFAALAVGGFGALLLAGRAPQRPTQAKHRSGRPAPPQGARADDYLKYVSGALAPYIQGGSAPPESAAAPADPGPQVVQAEPPSPITQTWQQVLDLVRPTVTEGEFRTWFAEAQLLQFDDGLAVVGVSNIFARDKLATCYQAQIAQALAAHCGRPVQVQIELGG
ncbi:MAG TPA: DnaA N-terminal domain-containing protein [Herpetosiphonaceae bacterium]